MCKGKEKDLSWEEKVRKNKEEGKADGEFSVIWELFGEFEEWLKEE